MSARPLRRSLTARRRAPRPRGRHAAPKRGLKHLAIEGMSAMNRALYRLPTGPWLRRRLEAEREFPSVELRLERAARGLHGLRIAFVSDLHAGCFMQGPDLVQLFEQVAAAEPDLVCLGGDLVESRRQEFLLFREALGLLRPPLGVYAIPGNHEHYADPSLAAWRACLEEHGAVPLVNQGRRLRRDGATFWLAGVDDLSRGRPDLAAALEDLPEEEPVVLLAHHPDFFVEAASAGVDLTLSGHTHGGQIMVAGRALSKHSSLGYWRGHYELDGAQLYVGRGAGTTGLPLRVEAPGEVPLIRILGDERHTDPDERSAKAAGPTACGPGA